MPQYRSWAERREIIEAVIAESARKPLSDFNLTASELVFFRARSARAVHTLARKTSAFKASYALPTARPFAFVILTSSMVIIAAAFCGMYVFVHTRQSPAYPIFAALISLSVVAAGWAVSGWVTHRNTIRQNTNAMLFARFSQATFGDAMHRFHHAFGHGLTPLVTYSSIQNLRSTGEEKDLKSAVSVGYLLNYFELISSGVLHGDLNPTIVRDNIRGVICYYHDKCEPYIQHANRLNPRVYENLIKVRTHYREP